MYNEAININGHDAIGNQSVSNTAESAENYDHSSENPVDPNMVGQGFETDMSTLEEVEGYDNVSQGFAETGQEFFVDEMLGGVDESVSGVEGSFMDEAPLEAVLGSFPELRTLKQSGISEVIIGRDDRRKIRNTRRFPWRAICQLTIHAKNGRRYIGTGWLVSPRTVITAGHCVYLHNAGGWAKSIEVSPGRNGSSRPYGACKATSFRSVKGWVRSRNSKFDYGCIHLPSNCRLGTKTGIFGFAAYSTNYLKGKYVNLSGYPGDKGGITQWYHARRISSLTSTRIKYQIDTVGGQSGSPVFIRKGSKRIAVGIHTTGSKSGNSGVRINSSVKNNLIKWAQAGA